MKHKPQRSYIMANEGESSPGAKSNDEWKKTLGGKEESSQKKKVVNRLTLWKNSAPTYGLLGQVRIKYPIGACIEQKYKVRSHQEGGGDLKLVENGSICLWGERQRVKPYHQNGQLPLTKFGDERGRGPREGALAAGPSIIVQPILGLGSSP